jgi:hypothetical protein
VAHFRGAAKSRQRVQGIRRGGRRQSDNSSRFTCFIFIGVGALIVRVQLIALFDGAHKTEAATSHRLDELLSATIVADSFAHRHDAAV